MEKLLLIAIPDTDGVEQVARRLRLRTVLGSMSMLDVNLVQNSAYNNAEYFVGLLNSVCGKEDSIVVASKDLTQTSISASATQLKAIRLVVVFLIPLAVVVAGVIVAVRRRYR